MLGVVAAHYHTTSDSVGKLHAAIERWDARRKKCKHDAVDCVTIDMSTPVHCDGAGADVGVFLKVDRFCCRCGAIDPEAMSTIDASEIETWSSRSESVGKVCTWIRERRDRW